MKKLIILLNVISIGLSAYAQHDLGLKLNGGVSCLNTNYHSDMEGQKVRFQFSGQGGVYYIFKLPKNFMVGAELLFVQIEGKNYTKIVLTDEMGQPTGEYGTLKNWFNISYLGFPVYFGYSIKKFTVSLGFQVNYMLTGSSIQKIEVPYNGEMLTFENIHKNLSIDNFDYGPRIGFTYGLSKRFSVEANYYYGLNNIMAHHYANMKWNIQQFTAGLRFKLFKMPVSKDF
jgi:hypothetical protein